MPLTCAPRGRCRTLESFGCLVFTTGRARFWHGSRKMVGNGVALSREKAQKSLQSTCGARHDPLPHHRRGPARGMATRDDGRMPSLKTAGAELVRWLGANTGARALRWIGSAVLSSFVAGIVLNAVGSAPAGLLLLGVAGVFMFVLGVFMEWAKRHPAQQAGIR